MRSSVVSLDYVYVMHPATSEISRMKDLVERFTPLGLGVGEMLLRVELNAASTCQALKLSGHLEY